jgi:PTS system fructose-specific IIC component
VAKLAAALGISEKGIQYQAADQQPVYVVFLVLADVNNPGPHVQCLGEIARLLSVPGFYDRLRRCTSARDVLAAIRAEEQMAWEYGHPIPDPSRR